MKILILEDKGGIAKDLQEDLLEKGYDVSLAYEVAEAKDIVKSSVIDWYIIDLNLSPSGLNTDEVKMTYGGIITGYIFASKYLVTEMKVKKQKIIFFSKYLKELNQFAQMKEYLCSEDLTEYHLIKKSGENFDKIIDLISNTDEKLS